MRDGARTALTEFAIRDQVKTAVELIMRGWHVHHGKVAAGQMVKVLDGDLLGNDGVWADMTAAFDLDWDRQQAP
ncbi:MAG: hypothetical protein E6I43_02495 [Chloroflexi bacterium]|nr:MAG: hypothetical protein E6I43_02495 [Chloroflexota bacterium]